MKHIDVLVVGSINMDLNAQVAALPAPGQTVHTRRFSTAPGGKGANQAVAAARLGFRVSMVGAVGTDEYGPVLSSGLAREGIAVDGVAAVDGPSGIALITIEEGGQNTIVVVPGANGDVSLETLRRHDRSFDEAAVVLLQLEIPMEVASAALRRGRAAGAVTILNPAPAYALSDDLLTTVDVLTPNETEAEAITGEADPEAAARQLLGRGVNAVVITLGEHGALLADRGGVKRFAPRRVEAVDATAAGDAFNGALAGRLARGDSVEEAVPFAMAAGTCAVTKLGAQPSLPSAAELAAFRDARTP
ncbi:MAG: ribokinase [Spirochaetales bacterium]|nr:ribokinase [Spirochaetales bacterium]